MKSRIVLMAALAGVSMVSSVSAATRTWAGGSGNWTPGIAGGFDSIWSATAIDNAVFSGTGGTVTVSGGPILFGDVATQLSFTGNNYLLSAASAQALTLNGATTANGSINISSGITATIGTNISLNRAASMTFTGGGTLNLTGTGATVNASVGNRTIQGGTTLNVGTGGTFTGAGSIVVGLAASGANLNVTGGTVNVPSGNFSLVLANAANATGTVTLGSGAININTSTSGAGLRYAGNGASGTFNLDGGTLTTFAVFETTGSIVSTFNFNGGTIRPTANNTTFMTGLDNAIVKAGGALIDTNSFNITIGQALAAGSPSGGLTKTGTGTLTLTGDNTYSGTTLVTGGTLSLSRVGGAILNSAPVTVNGGTLDVASADTVGAIVLSSGTISGAGTLTGSSYTLEGGTITAPLGGGAAINKSTSGVVNLGGSQSYTSATNVNAGTLNITGSLANTVVTVSNNASLGGEGSTGGNVVFNSGSTLLFDATTTGAGQFFKTTGGATIDASAGGVKLALASAVTSGTGIVIAEAAGGWGSTSIANFTLLARGSIAFSGNQLLYNYGVGNIVWKGNAGNSTFWDVNTTQNWDNVGTPDVFLVGDNVTFDDSGVDRNVAIQVPIVAGTVSFTNTSGNDYAMSGSSLTASTLTKSGSGRVSVSNAITVGSVTLSDGTFQLGDGLNATGTVSSAITNNAALALNFGANDVTVPNAISGSGTLAKDGAGKVTLTGAITHTGATTVNGGTLAFSNSGINTSGVTLATTIGGSGAVEKLGAGLLTLTNANAYTGATTITAGSVVVSGGGALGSPAGGTAVASGASLGLSGGLTVAEPTAIAGNGVAAANHFFVGSIGSRGAIQSIVGHNTFAGNIELNANGASRIGTQDGASLTITGAITQAAGITTGTVLFRAGNSNGDFITLSNSGNSFGDDASIFTGAGVGNLAGVRLGISDALPTNRTISGVNGNTSAAALDLAGFDQTLNGLISGSGSLKIINSSATIASTLTLDPTSDKASSNTVISNDGSGVIHVVKSGTSNQTLSGINTYTGTTTIGAGTLTLATTGSINNSTVIDVQAGATLDVSTKSTTFVVGNAQALKGNGTVNGNTIVDGTLAPGSSAGQLNFTNGNLSLGNGIANDGLGAILNFEINGAGNVPGIDTNLDLNNQDDGFDRVVVSAGSLAYDGTLNVSFQQAASANANFDLFDFASATGNFESINIGGAYSTVLNLGNAWTSVLGMTTFSFNHTDGVLSLSVAAVPEPLTAAGVILLTCRTLGRRSRTSI